MIQTTVRSEVALSVSIVPAEDLLGDLLHAVFWDVDGTLADTEMMPRRRFNAAFEELGLPISWEPELYSELLSIPEGCVCPGVSVSM